MFDDRPIPSHSNRITHTLLPWSLLPLQPDTSFFIAPILVMLDSIKSVSEQNAQLLRAPRIRSIKIINTSILPLFPQERK